MRTVSGKKPHEECMHHSYPLPSTVPENICEYVEEWSKQAQDRSEFWQIDWGKGNHFCKWIQITIKVFGGFFCPYKET